MKKLIVNADDFGLCTSVNKAIIECHLAGNINSTTLMANMPGTEEAVELSKKHTIPPELLRSEKAQEEDSTSDKSGPRLLTTILATVLSMLAGGTVFYVLYRLAMGQPLMPF